MGGDARARLELQQARRGQGVPTVSALVGSPSDALELWQRVHSGRPRWALDADRAVGSLQALLSPLPLRRWAAERVGLPRPVHLDARTAHERAALRRGRHASAETVAHRLLFDAGTDAEAAQLLVDEAQGDAGALLAQALGLMEPSHPALWLGASESAWRLSKVLAAACPSVPVGVSLTLSEARTVLPRVDRAWAALVREGLVELPPSLPPATREILAACAAPAAVWALATSAAEPPLAAPPAPSIAGRIEGSSEAESDGARSAAERFLFRVLELRPATRGRFELNGLLPTAERALEVDLLARRERLAIELDGYFHFHDPEAYRRDRRKDWALQQAGYVVLRFLSDDVVPGLERILATIDQALTRPRTP